MNLEAPLPQSESPRLGVLNRSCIFRDSDTVGRAMNGIRGDTRDFVSVQRSSSEETESLARDHSFDDAIARIDDEEYTGR